MARLGPAPERTKAFRAEAFRAVRAAQRAGALGPLDVWALAALLEHSDSAGGDRRWYLATIGRWCNRSPRTAGRWTARLIAAGWLQRHHYRTVDEGGTWRTWANAWRVVIPEAWLAPPPPRARNVAPRAARTPPPPRPPGYVAAPSAPTRPAPATDNAALQHFEAVMARLGIRAP